MSRNRASTIPRKRGRKEDPQTKARARTAFERTGGTLRTSEALAAGVHPRTLYAMRDDGELIQLSRGLYRLADLPLPAEPDLVAVAQRIPCGVVCLISALAIHELTDQIPHAVHIAVARNARPPRIDYPPVRAHRFDDAAFDVGVEERTVDGTTLRVYGPEKTIADSFKFRREVGKDVALEALRRYVRRGRPRLDELLRYARICRVEKVVRPALEVLL